METAKAGYSFFVHATKPEKISIEHEITWVLPKIFQFQDAKTMLLCQSANAPLGIGAVICGECVVFLASLGELHDGWVIFIGRQSRNCRGVIINIRRQEDIHPAILQDSEYLLVGEIGELQMRP